MLLILGVAFYWYELRPAQAKKACVKKAGDFYAEARKGGGTFDELYKSHDFIYKNCLRQKGI